ncbi:MAG: hypothetical protein A2096_06100 [Spirochaetes bacterium GWF1_41_5]|nr:MAG: hypothetical protein A2096_06100 [Spirochaetes bacterium GWF1_41_5]
MKELEKLYSKKAIEYANYPRNIGRMNDPDGGAAIKGLCGDTMEIYFILDDGRVSDIKFFTDGCGATLACGSSATELAKGKTIDEMLTISPKDVLNDLGKIPEPHIHCAILSVMTVHKAVAYYLLKKNAG